MTRTQIATACFVVGLGGVVLWSSALLAMPPAPCLDAAVQVYEAILQDGHWSDSKVLVNEHLASAPVSSDKEIADCLQGISFHRGALSAPDSLRGATFRHKGIELVDGEQWHADDEQLNAAVARGEFQDADLEKAFAHALISFSRIQFDRSGRLALLSFSHVCGELCGMGVTLLVKRNENGWAVLERCRLWQS